VGAKKELSEVVLNVFSESIQLSLELGKRSSWRNELHSGQLVADGLGEGLFNEGHGDFPLHVLGLSEDLPTLLVVRHDTLHHTDRLYQWAVVIVLREGVLLQELFLDELSNLESSLLLLIKRVFTNQLHNFDQIVLILQDPLDGLLELHELRVLLVVILSQDSIVVGI